MSNRGGILVAVAAGAALWASLVTTAAAESSEGGAFRLPGYGARAWGMAGAVVARVDDESAVDWNPAGMASCARTLGLAYVDLVPGTSLGQSQAVFVMPLGEARDLTTGRARHVAGAMLTHLSADIGDGQSYRENHLRAAYAFTPEPLLTVAMAGQAFLSSSGVAGFDAWGTSVDLAARLSLTRKWSVAFVGRDVFSRFSYDDGRDYRKEAHYVFGLGRRGLRGVDLEADVVYAYGDWTRGVLGAETDYFFRHIALRGGVAFLNAGEARTAYTFGASVRAAGERLSVHYGASLDDEDAFGTTHRVSLGVRL